MNTSFIYSFATSLFVALLMSCGSSTDPTPAPTCKLTKSFYTIYPVGSTVASNTNTITYTYEGELLKTKVDSYVTTGTGASTVATTTNYIYNADGFVTSENFNYTTSGGMPATATIAYGYNANGKLTTLGNTNRYQYDASGNLSTIIIGNITRTYAGGVLTGITSTSAYPVYTVLNGRITQVQNSATFRIEYAYDAQGRLSETKLYSGGSSNKTLYEYETVVPPATSSVPVFKGVPTIPLELGIAGYVKKTTQTNAAGVVMVTTDYVNSFKPNSHPNSIVRNTTNSSANGGSTYSQGTVYSYIDCN